MPQRSCLELCLEDNVCGQGLQNHTKASFVQTMKIERWHVLDSCGQSRDLLVASMNLLNRHKTIKICGPVPFQSRAFNIGCCLHVQCMSAHPRRLVHATGPFNKSWGQVSSCELAISAPKSSRGYSNLVTWDSLVLISGTSPCDLFLKTVCVNCSCATSPFVQLFGSLVAWNSRRNQSPCACQPSRVAQHFFDIMIILSV